MSHRLLPLLGRRRFAPLFATQFLGAFNDNLYKNALAILVAYRLAEAQELDGPMLVTAAGGLFILPFFLFSATAGQLADRMDKARLIRFVKAAEIAVMGCGAAAFWIGDPALLLGVLFLMGTQSAFFGPLKYGILPDHLRPDELIAGNGLVEMGTFLAILTGTMAGALLVLAPGGIGLVSALVIGLAVAGFLAARAIPPAPAADPGLVVSWNLPAETWRLLRDLRAEPPVGLAVLGISWFWLLGATFLVQFPNYARDHLNADESVVTLFLTLFSVGVGIGSLLCNRLLAGRVRVTFVPLAALLITLCAGDLHFATPAVPPGGAPADWATFAGEAANWRILLDLTGLSLAGGLYVVPLYAVMQTRTAARHRARTVAANNVLNALFMTLSAALAGVLFGHGMTVVELFLGLAAANLWAVGMAVVLGRMTADAR